MIDGKSDSSTVSLVEWGDSSVKEISYCETEEGISEYMESANLDGVSDGLISCIERLTFDATVRMEGLKVYLAATEDMRIADKDGEDRASRVYAQITEDLKEKGLQPIKIGTLDDSEELTCTWLSTNFKSGALLPQGHGQATAGVLELSKMIERSAFEVNATSRLAKLDTSTLKSLSLTLFGSEYHVLTYHSLCSGMAHSQFRQVTFGSAK